jgi:pimeloyl-ACP methyl ester carboxylesterase
MMPSLNSEKLPIGDLSIAVHQTAGRGLPIVLVHGNSMSSRAFGHQLEGELGRIHRLVAIDLPGHGASSWARDPAKTYTLPAYAKVLVEVVRRLVLGRAVFVGWSLGGHVLLEASEELPRAAGIAIMGAPPLGFPPAMDRAFVPLPTLGVAFSEDARDEDVAAFLATLVKPGGAVPSTFAEDFRRTDKRARGVLAASIGPNGYRDELDVVARCGRPLAIFHGEHDQIVNRAYYDDIAPPNLWTGAIRIIGGAGHAPQFEAPTEFDALVQAFVRDCARAGQIR